MKKNWLITLIILLIIGTGILIGILLYKPETNNFKEIQEEKTLANNNNIENNTNDVKSILTNYSEIITSPYAILIFKRNYSECGHTTNEKIDIPKELVNINKEELQREYKDWTIEQFTSNEIILSKNENGICNEHYIIKENNGYICVYYIDKYENETLKETTGIVTNYLPQTDIEKLKQGIKVNGKEELNATLEDYE